MEEAEDVVIIPVKDRSKETLGSCTLKSLNKLKKHKEQVHGHGKDKLFYCSE